MRLIDADKVKKYILEDGFYRDTKSDEDNAELVDILFPTVKAIPIEWIKEWYKKALSKSGFMGDEMVSVEDLLEDWEKENEHKESD